MGLLDLLAAIPTNANLRMKVADLERQLSVRTVANEKLEAELDDARRQISALQKKQEPPRSKSDTIQRSADMVFKDR